jgi:hypothetical protein
MVVFLYRWKIRAGKEKQFEESWTFVTKELREKEGSLGSRLHLGSDGFFYGYAQWPSHEARDSAKFSIEMKHSLSLMKAAIEESLDEVVLDPIADFLKIDKGVINLELKT